MKCTISIHNQTNEINNDPTDITVTELFDKLYEYDYPQEIHLNGILTKDEPQCINYTLTLRDDSYEIKTTHGRYYKNTLPTDIDTTLVQFNDIVHELQIILSIVYNNEETKLEESAENKEQMQGGRHPRRNRSFKIKRTKNC